MTITNVSGPVIAAGESVSGALNVSGNNGIRRITFPAAWTKSAWLTFQFSTDNATWNELYYAGGAPVVVTVTPNATVMLAQDIWQSGYFKFRSGSVANPIIQLEARNFICGLE